MATSSITKEFYIKDSASFESLKSILDNSSFQNYQPHSPSLEKARAKLELFAFRKQDNSSN